MKHPVNYDPGASVGSPRASSLENAGSARPQTHQRRHLPERLLGMGGGNFIIAED